MKLWPERGIVNVIYLDLDVVSNNVILAHLNPCHLQGRVRDKFTYSVCIMQIEVLC